MEKENILLDTVLNTFGTYVRVKDKKGNIIYTNIPNHLEKELMIKEEKNFVEGENFFSIIREMKYEGKTLILEGFQNFSSQMDKLLVDPKTETLSVEGMLVNFKTLLKNKIPFVLGMFDFDNFKDLNDNYGHLLADKVLKAVVDLFKANTRNSDLIGRYGGDEFIVIMPYVDAEVVKKKFDKLIKKMNKGLTIDKKNKVVVTISVGVIQYNYKEKLEENLEKVDEALYISKNNGKGQVTIYNKLKKVK